MTNNDPEKPESFILAIESSGRVGSVALGRGPNLLEEIVFSGKMRHSSELFPTLSTLLANAGCTPGDIRMLCFTAGPGSFTGLRIAVTTAKILNFAQKTRLIAVDTLDVIAQNATEYIDKTGQHLDKIAPILDAKQNHFFSAVFKNKNTHWSKELDDALVSGDMLIKEIKDSKDLITVLGEGLLYHSELFKTNKIKILPPEYWPARARNVLKIGVNLAAEGKFSDPLTLVPSYIRQPDAIDKWNQKNLP